MKNKNLKTVAVILSITMLIAQSSAWAQTAGAQQREISDSFTGISLSIPATVHLTQSSAQSVKIDASSDDLQHIVTKIEGGTLMIKSDKNNHNFSKGIEIYVSLDQLKELSLAGSGLIVADEIFNVDELELSIAGSGDISFADLVASELEVSIAGSGDLLVKGGQSKKLEVSIAGSGDCNLGSVQVSNAEVSIAGSGDVSLFCTQRLDVSIVGSGDVVYKGSPSIEKSIMGSGDVRAEN